MADYQEVSAIYNKAKAIGERQGGYLAVLDDILEQEGVKTPSEYKMRGSIQIPLDQIDGTRTEGRKEAFSSGFMPLLDENTEFASKWKALCEAHLDEGIRDPIKVYEYKNRFYVLEGNKRTSVLKYFDAGYAYAEVIRIIPPRTGDRENRIYYEYIEFYDLSQVNYIYFKSLGGFARLQQKVGKRPDEAWDDDDRMNFKSVYTRFLEELKAHNDGKKPEAPGEAFLEFLGIYDYADLCELSMAEFRDIFDKYWRELQVMASSDPLEVQVEPADLAARKKSLIKRLFSSPRHLTVGFVYAKTPQTSSWTNMHELGRLHLEDSFPDEITTIAYENVDETNEWTIMEKAIEDGCNIIFTTSPNQMDVSVRAAMEHPEIIILNCSLRKPSHYVRTYYARMYESKFIMGAIAGCMSENGKIGYLADYPIYGSTANINAFAMGAKMVNPRARIYLKWLNVRNPLPEDAFTKHNISYVSGRDSILLNDANRQFGLYVVGQDMDWNLAMPVWNWGSFYEKMIQNVIDGSFDKDNSGLETKGMSYWWGISSGVADVITSSHLPIGTQKLVALLKNCFTVNSYNPFQGTLYCQEGLAHEPSDGTMSPGDIMNIEWLTENVVGKLPTFEELTDEAQELVKVQGLPCYHEEV